MPSSFQRYQNGVTPVTGLAEAGANIGRMYQQGFASLGDSMAKGIEQYYKNSALNDNTIAKGERAASQLMFYRNIASQSPENAGLLPEIDSQLKSLQNLHKVSLSKKEAIVNAAEVSLNQFLPNFQLNTIAQAQRAKTDFSKAMEATPDARSKDSDFFVQSNPIDPTKPVSAQLDSFLTNAYNQRAKNGASSLEPDDELISRWTKANKKAIDEATARGQLPADVAGRLTDQLDSVSRYRSNEMTPEGESTDYAKEAQLYEAINTPAYQAKKTAQPTGDSGLGDINKQIESLKAQKDALDKKAAAGIDNKAGLSDVAGVTTDFLTSGIENRYQLETAAYWDKLWNGTISPRRAKQLADEQGTLLGTIRTYAANIATPFQMVADAITGTDGLTQAEKNNLISAMRQRDNVIKSSPNYNALPFISKPSASAASDIQSRINELTSQAEQIKSSQKAAQTAEQAKVPAPVGGGMLLAGIEKKDVPLTMEEKRKEVQGWYQKEYGYIPSSFSQIWQSYNPQPTIKADRATGTYWSQDEKGGWKQVDMPKPPSIEDTSLARAVQFGTWNENGQPMFEERAKGIYASGILRSANPKAEAPEFEKQIKYTADVRRLVKELLPYYDSKLNSIRPEKYQEVVPILNKLRASVRPEIIGTGQQNEAERKQVIEAVGSPEKFFSWLGAEKAKLLMLEKMQMEGLQSEGKRFNVQIEFRDDQSNEGMIRNLRQQKALSQPR